MLRTPLRTSLHTASAPRHRTFAQGRLFPSPLFAALFLFLLSLIPVAAFAQFGMMNNAQMAQDTITRRGLEKYGTLLGLDKDQRDAAKALFEGHQSSSTALQKEMGEKMKELGEKAGESGDFSVYQKEMPAMMKVFAERGEKLEEGFFADLKDLCTAEQADNWDAVTRFRRREKAMRFGFVSGSAVDLVAVVEKLKATPQSPTELQDTLLQYELEIDKLLIEFERVGKESQKDMLDDGAMFDMGKIEKMMRKFYDSGAQVRDVNRKYERRIAPLLTEADRTKLDSEIKRRAFPKIYKASRPQQLLDAAGGFSDLTSEQREQLTAIKDSYARDAAPINERWAKAAEEKEEKAGGAVMVMMQGFQGQPADDDPVKVAREARKELDDKAKDRIENILTKDQVAKLPAKKSDGFNPMADFVYTDEEDEKDAAAK